MATIGEQLLQPESGWIRYDDTDSNINYVGTKQIVSGSKYSNGSLMYFQPSENCTIKFNFIGSKIRLIDTMSSNRSSNMNIKIDDVNYIFSDYSPSSIDQRLIFEKTGLLFKEHFVEISNNQKDTVYGLDAIDIDENGRLRPYNSNLYKYLIKQDNNYYSINNNYIDLGTIDNNEELYNLINNSGYDDLSIITKELNTKKIPTKLENDYYKSFDVNLNDVKASINLIEEDDKKYIEYGCNNYKISDKIKEINNAKFEVLMKE
ncbi:hypothetical protein ACP49_16610 [Clostridium botulinum]|uniref:hypothetical protein n=1 Tax=Clostridium botulinum TaxID=1491 RepID=UPI0005F94B3B|nr:hypothetical protein [Clostridium botulinum]KOM97149.1 hypothetical protein ACP53_11785 [Clostridium botulinum]KOM99566.1 hypothetical protein ACP49_16610 [Clostridium botulinum]MBY7004474.1 hypothetical protein [Clostridium botulinum]MCR1147137.1 hypothetical protein [Clostridium botulinum]NFH94588.1 hypothetical protein [Clostridium botulinum]